MRSDQTNRKLLGTDSAYSDTAACEAMLSIFKYSQAQQYTGPLLDDVFFWVIYWSDTVPYLVSFYRHNNIISPACDELFGDVI